MRGFVNKALKNYKSIIGGDWPVVNTIGGYEPNMIFLLTPPNSGSTAIAQVFNNSQNVSQFQSHGEGQWLIKGLCKGDRWDKKKSVNKRSIRSIWVNECHKKYTNEGALYFIEKSPPNMVRIELLQSLFQSHILLANNRDPYANVSSIFYRYNKDVEKLSVTERNARILRIVKAWVMRSSILKEIIQSQNVPYLSYEKFCKNPRLLQNVIDRSIFGGQIKLDFDKILKVKDYKPQAVINFNQKQIAKLTNSDIEAITSYLRNSEDLLSYFGYALRR